MRGNARGAVNSAWDVVNDALIHGDRVTVEEAERLAKVIGESTEGKVRADAERLASYCRLSLEGVGTGVQASSVVGRMLGRTKKRKCPDCAEKISVEAKVCPHCRYRFPTD
jgi:hypothetical protein